MLKAVLLSLIIFSCTAIGKLIANARRRRMDALGALLTALRVLRLRMLNSMEPLGILLRRSDSAFLKELGNSLWEGASLEDCWAQRRDEFRRRGHPLESLGQGDLKLLDGLFSGLGRSGKDEQNNLFTEVLTQLEAAQAEAREKYAEAAKAYTALGALVGIAISVLIA